MRSLTLKLTFAFIGVSLAGIVLVAIFARQITLSEFDNFLVAQDRDDTMESLVTYFEENNTWQGVQRAFRPGRGASLAGFVLATLDGTILLGDEFHPAGRKLKPNEIRESETLVVDGEQVGLFWSSNRPRPSRPNQQPQNDFVETVQQSMILGAIGAGLIALILGILLARNLIHPLRELTQASRAVAEGDLSQQVTVRSQDELGQLAESFNQMNQRLAHARDLRRQMTADIAHDLRTPLSIILGHAEGLVDGVLPATTDTFEIIHDEAQHLSRLIADLRLLSLSEAGELPLHKQPSELVDLLSQVASSHEPQANAQQVKLKVEVSAPNLTVNIDHHRIQQVLNNLVINALRYSSGDTIQLSADSVESRVYLKVSDNGQGIPQEDLPYVFERFYRADKSRQREGSGSGLGLAIAKSIVEAHGGTIRVDSQVGQGTTFTMAFPQSEISA